MALPKPVVLGWRILQVLFPILALITICQRRQPCPLQASSIVPKDQAKSIKTHDDFYTRPISDRTPAQGIETVLATSKTKPPFHFFLHAKHNDFVTERIVKSGVYEKDSTTALIDAIVCQAPSTEKPLLVLDLGANIGFHSLHMASCGARVVSFEASPDTAWLLTSSARLNGFLRDRPSPQESHTMTLVPRGVSNATATARLSRHPNSPGMTSFVAADQTPFGLQAGNEGTALDVDIPLVRAQDVLDSFQISPDTYNLRFLKIDVEGFEYQALQGLDLSKFPVEYLTFEFFPALLMAGGTDPVELLVYIWKEGYRYVEYKQGNQQKGPEDYNRIPMGSSQATVRTWAKNLVASGYQRQKQDFHVNLLARRVK